MHARRDAKINFPAAGMGAAAIRRMTRTKTLTRTGSGAAAKKAMAASRGEWVVYWSSSASFTG